MESSTLPWERIRQAQLHTVARLHSHVLMYPTQFVIERLHPQFCDTYIMERSSLTTIKAGLCVLLLSLSPILCRLIQPPDSSMSLTTRHFLLVSFFCGPLLTFAVSIAFWRKLREKSFQHSAAVSACEDGVWRQRFWRCPCVVSFSSAISKCYNRVQERVSSSSSPSSFQHSFFCFAKFFLPALFYNGLGPWGEPTSAKYMLREAYQWENDFFGSSDLIVLSVSMATMVFLSTSVAGCLDAGARGLVVGSVLGIVMAWVSLSLLNSILGANADLQSCVDAELKDFQPHWKVLGYRSDLSHVEGKDEHLQAAVSDAADLFEKMATRTHAGDSLDERLDDRVYENYLLETPFDVQAVSLMSAEERRDLQELGRRIRVQGVEILRRLLLWLHRHSNELTSSKKSCWKLFKAESKCSIFNMEVFACDEYALAVLSLLDIATFLGVFFDSQLELLPKIGWTKEHILTKVFIANPQQFLYELDMKSTGDMWYVRASLDTYLADEQADKQDGEPDSEQAPELPGESTFQYRSQKPRREIASTPPESP
mmetsp:Transcript_106348/g.184895  ORF Transcript_106348/g.184895 Transcript_106348/m.184895 type:complete len:540 (-) Transcript_106348:74-1693(-)